MLNVYMQVNGATDLIENIWLLQNQTLSYRALLHAPHNTEGGSDVSAESLWCLLGDVFSEHKHEREMRFPTADLFGVKSSHTGIFPPINEIPLSGLDSSLDSSDEERGHFC